MKILIAVLAAALLTAAPAQASPGFSDEEVEFIQDAQSLGIVNADGVVGLVNGGWAICGVLSQGYSRDWVSQQVYTGSQRTNGAAGLPYSAAQALVFYASADLCPGVTR